MANTKVKAEQLEAAQTSITSVGTLTGLDIGSNSHTGADPAFGVSIDVNDYVAQFANTRSTAGQAYGVRILAGTNSSDSSLYVRNKANDTDYFMVKGDGHVGIGTASPDVNSFGAGHGVLTVQSGTGSAKTAMLNLSGDGNDTDATRVASLFFNDASATGAGKTLAGVEAYRASNHATDPGGVLVFSTNSSGGSYTEKMRIQADGTVRIGAHAELSHPNAYTYQTLKVQNTNDTQVCIDLHKSDGVKVATYYGDSQLSQGFLGSAYGWVFKVDNSGNAMPTASLGLAGGSNTGLSCELYHPNTSAWQTLGIKNNDDSTQCAIEMFSSQGTKRAIVYGATDYYGFLNQSASWSLKGDSSGNWVATGTITGSSDIRLKEKINTIPNALEKVTKLRGVEFTWKSKQEREIGLIAQEVKEVVPELVTITNNKTDADPDGLEDLHTMKYQNTVALLIEAIKELSAKVKELESK